MHNQASASPSLWLISLHICKASRAICKACAGFVALAATSAMAIVASASCSLQPAARYVSTCCLQASRAPRRLPLSSQKTHATFEASAAPQTSPNVVKSARALANSLNASVCSLATSCMSAIHRCTLASLCASPAVRATSSAVAAVRLATLCMPTELCKRAALCNVSNSSHVWPTDLANAACFSNAAAAFAGACSFARRSKPALIKGRLPSSRAIDMAPCKASRARLDMPSPTKAWASACRAATSPGASPKLRKSSAASFA
mmetsp:Transcript_6437/g.15875  ORF Transcript_6437/g.15875 Transcript_6437/m.15875 type:complete len:261 (+) Transcript_6437:1326-2108(+)